MRWSLWVAACGLALGCGGDDKSESTPSGGGPGAADSGSASGDDTGPVEMDCPEDTEVFQARVYDPVLGPFCVGCHFADGPAAGTQLVLDPDDMLQNLRSTSRVADLLLLKPTGLHEGGHGGGELILPDTDAYDALSFWVDWTQGICDEEEAPPCDDGPTARRLWRLDHAQYQRTVEDLLGVATDYGESLASDVRVDGFANDAEALAVSGLLADQYRSAAEDLASAVDIAGMLDCTPEEGSTTQCAATFIEELGTRAFRRPITDDELTVYLTLWADVAEEDGFFEGLRWVVAGMLQSPHFLYRSELGYADGSGNFSLSSWEVASELSYLIWGTMPDEALFAAAAADALQTPEEIALQAERLLADDRALETTADLVDVWLQLGQLYTVAREDLSGEVMQAMTEQTRETVKGVAGADGSLSSLLLGSETYLPPALATHYGEETSGWVEQDGEQYGGLLTHGSLLTVYALADGSSPVHRGVAVRERMLCEELPPPPANLDTSPPAADADGTTREKYEVHSSLPECASCHALIDPIGFGFEHYDHLGRWRGEEVGQPIDATGSVDGLGFDGVQELTELLGEDPRFRACFVETWRRWGTGSEACAEDEGDVSLMGPLADITARVAFTQRLGAPEGDDTRSTGTRMSVAAIGEVATLVGEVSAGGGSAGVEFALTEVSTWASGFCSDGTVTNTTSEPVVWEVRGDVSGTITSIWNANVEVDGDEHVFTGVEWNAEIPGFGSTTFGFCGER